MASEGAARRRHPQGQGVHGQDDLHRHAGGQRDRPGRALVPEDRHRRRPDDRPAEPDLRQLRGARRARVDGRIGGLVPRLRRAAERDRRDARRRLDRARVGAGPLVRGPQALADVRQPGRAAGGRPVDRWPAPDAPRDPVGRSRGDPRGRGDGRQPHVEPLPRQRRRRLDRRRRLRLQAGRNDVQAGRCGRRRPACRPSS